MGKVAGNWDQRKNTEHDEKYCGRCSDVGRGKSDTFDMLQGVAQGCTQLPINSVSE